MPEQHSSTLEDYFSKKFTVCAVDSGVTIDPNIIDYVIDLLCRYAHDVPEVNAPLGIKLQSCLSLPVHDRLFELQSVGDHALYMSGYMRPYVSKTHSSPHYLMQLGQDAYTRFSRLTKAANPRTAASQLFDQLAKGFQGISDVLSTMSTTVILGDLSLGDAPR